MFSVYLPTSVAVCWIKICVEAFNRANFFFTEGSFYFLVPSEARAGPAWEPLRSPWGAQPRCKKGHLPRGSSLARDRSHTKDKNTPFFSWGPTPRAGETYLPHNNEKKSLFFWHSAHLAIIWEGALQFSIILSSTHTDSLALMAPA